MHLEGMSKSYTSYVPLSLPPFFFPQPMRLIPWCCCCKLVHADCMLLVLDAPFDPLTDPDLISRSIPPSSGPLKKKRELNTDIYTQVSVHSGQTLAKLPLAAAVNSLAWHPSKNWLAYSVVSKGTIVWYIVHAEG